jgi:hypothetical protein
VVLRAWVMLSVLLCAVGGVAAAESYTGTYRLQTQAGLLTLALTQDPTGNVTGTLSSPNGSIRLQGSEGEGEIVGTGSDGKTKVHFEAELEGTELHFLLAGVDATGQPDYSQAKEMTFMRTSKSASAAPKQESKARKPPTPDGQMPSAKPSGKTHRGLHTLPRD